jgi:hypothetical protein
MLGSIVVGRCCSAPRIPSPKVLFTNDTVDPEVTNPLAELFNHRLAHQAHPPQSFANLTLSWPVEFTFVIFNIWFVFFIC